ncbi:MAG: exosortase J, partial [Janthinobacterium lividum]
YLIGAALFFVAIYFLSSLIQRLGGAAADQSGSVLILPVTESKAATHASASFYLRTAALTIMGVAGLVSVVTFFHAAAADISLQADEHALGQFPQTTGGYTLTRAWNENLMSGALLFHWADYAPVNGGTHIQVGISPLMGSHDTMVCHSARGEDPLWHGATTYATHSESVSFSTSFYNDGATQYLEASTLCNGSACGEYSSPRTHFGFVYSRPSPRALLDQNPERPIPILLKAETIDTTLSANIARQQLSADMASFLFTVNLDALTRPYRHSQ